MAGLAIPLLASTPGAQAQPAPDSDNVWSQTSTDLPRQQDGNKRRVNPQDFTAYTLDAGALDGVLADAPLESAAEAPVTLKVPNPDGELVEFSIEESPIMEDGFAAAHPDIKTYAGTAKDSAATIRLDVTPMGFHASVREPGKASWYVDPAYNNDADGPYLTYLGRDLPTRDPLVEPEKIAKKLSADAPADLTGEGPGEAVNLRTYQLALLTDQSYARYFGSENVAAEKVTLMNRVNQIYNDDLAVRMILIDETDDLNFDTDAKAIEPNGPCGAAACFTQAQLSAGCTGSLLNRNRIVIGQVVGASKFDVGHIALGFNGGGVAGLGVIGGSGKARGCTGLPQPEGDYMAVDYVAHELGHQYGGNHTFNGTQYNCGGNKAAPSVEPGSGSSVMAYAGICQQDNLQPHSDPYFSQWTQFEITRTILANPVAVSEVQTASLRAFDGTDGFTLGYGGQTSAPIVRGTNYTAAGIKAAVEAILPTGGTVSVSGFGGGLFDDTGFQVTFGASLAGTDVEMSTLTPTAGDVTGFVSDTAQGGPSTNGGDTVTATENHNPTVTAAEDVTIPMRTPFALTGSATDTDDDELTYIWEQVDRGANSGTGLVDQVKTNGPIFRIFGTYADVTPAAALEYHSPGQNLADGSPTRVFPDMGQILANNTNAMTGKCPDAPAVPETGGASNVPVPTVDCFSEWLPTADYVGSSQAGNQEPSLNFRLTARDGDPGAGGYAWDDTKVTIDKAAGPFQVNSKNTPASAVAGRTEAVRWLVNGTDKASLAPNVKISLSVDGGQTWEHVLAESTPNDGEESVTWPSVATTKARIKIEAVGNVFFDVNNADFTITTDQGPDTTITSAPDDIVLSKSATVEFESDTKDATFDCTLDGAVVPCTASPLQLSGLRPGTHTVEVAAIDLGGVKDATPATTSFTVARDDRALIRESGQWKRQSSGAFYLGTFTTVTKKPGATLWTDVSGATELALVAQTTPNAGKVQVYLGKKLLKTVNLGKAKANQVIFRIPLEKASTGTVRVVTKNKKVVKLDGLAVVTQ